jgi:hypothetical protein
MDEGHISLGCLKNKVAEIDCTTGSTEHEEVPMRFSRAAPRILPTRLVG